jgi:hypothetical protein
MMRALYRGLLWLHPTSFEERFTEELLWIFDLRRASETGIALLLDGFVSLCRQWLFRSGLWKFGIGLLVNATLLLCSILLTRHADEVRAAQGWARGASSLQQNQAISAQVHARKS